MGKSIYAFRPGERYVISNGKQAWWYVCLDVTTDRGLLAQRLTFETIERHPPLSRRHLLQNGKRSLNILPVLLEVGIDFFSLSGKTANAASSKWIFQRDSNFGHLKRAMEIVRGEETLYVTFGPIDSLFAIDKDGYRWNQLPDALEEKLQGGLQATGWGKSPRIVALGRKKSFVFINSRGYGK